MELIREFIWESLINTTSFWNVRVPACIQTDCADFIIAKLYCSIRVSQIQYRQMYDCCSMQNRHADEYFILEWRRLKQLRDSRKGQKLRSYNVHSQIKIMFILHCFRFKAIVQAEFWAPIGKALLPVDDHWIWRCLVSVPAALFVATPTEIKKNLFTKTIDMSLGVILNIILNIYYTVCI